VSDQSKQAQLTVPTIGRRQALGALFFLSLINFLNQVDRRVLVTLFPLIQGEWGVSDAQLGLAVSLFTLARALTVFPAGWLADRRGVMRTLRPSVLIWAVLGTVSACVGRFGAFVGLRTGVGALDGANNPLDLAYLGVISPKAKRGLYLAVYSATLYIGSGVGVIYAGALGERHGWRLALILPAGLGLLAGLGLFALPKATGARANLPSGEWGNFSWLLKKGLPTIFISGALGMFASTALVSWLPTYLTRFHGLGLAQAGLITGGLIIPASVAGALVGGQLSDRSGRNHPRVRYWVSCSGLVLSMVFGLAGLLAADLVWTLAFFFLCALSFTLPVSPMLVLVQEAVPTTQLATTQAAFGLVSQVLGAAPATGLVGLLSDRVGLQWALMSPFLAAGLGGILIASAGRRLTEI